MICHLSLLGAALGGLAGSACTKSQAQRVQSTQHCDAAITVIGATKACPTAEVRFRLSVPTCPHSAGTFTYDYKEVNEVTKKQITRTGTWSDGATAWDQVEKVPLACDAEIDDVDNVRVADCNCPSNN